MAVFCGFLRPRVCSFSAGRLLVLIENGTLESRHLVEIRWLNNFWSEISRNPCLRMQAASMVVRENRNWRLQVRGATPVKGDNGRE